MGNQNKKILMRNTLKDLNTVKKMTMNALLIMNPYRPVNLSFNMKLVPVLRDQQNLQNYAFSLGCFFAIT